MAGTTYTNPSDMVSSGLQSYDITTGVIAGRTIVAGTNTTVTNGSGIVGNPAVNVATSAPGVPGIASFDPYDFVNTAGAIEQRNGSAVYFVGKWGNDAADGLTFSSAKLTLQAAVTAAPAGSTIELYPGTYTESITHGVSNVMVKAQGYRTNVIITQADAAAVINIGAQTNIIYQDVTIQETAATANNRNTIAVSTGNVEFRQCSLRMVCAANIANARQPAVAEITAAGTVTIRRGTIDYLHTGNGGATAIKSAFLVGNGSLFTFSDVRQVTVTNSGTALMSTMCYDQSNTGSFTVRGSNITVTDPNSTSVVGFGFIGNAAVTNEFFKNILIVTGSGANSAIGLTAADVGSTTRLAHNRINVTGGATNYSYNIGAAAIVISEFDVVVAASGKTGAGTLTCVYSPSNGTETISGSLILQGSTDHGLLVGRATSAVASLTVGNTGEFLIGASGANPAFGTTSTSDGAITLQNATGGLAKTLLVKNNNNVANGSAQIVISVAGDSSSDPTLQIANVSGPKNWTLGSRTSDAAHLYLCAASDLSTGLIEKWYLSGAVVKPLNPSFFAVKSSVTNNVTGTGTAYNYIADTEKFDTGSNFNNGTGVFTAPVTGRYLAIGGIEIVGTTVCEYARISVVHSGGITYNGVMTKVATSTSYNCYASFIIQMTAGDTLKWYAISSGEVADTDDLNGSADPALTYSGAYLLG